MSSVKHLTSDSAVVDDDEGRVEVTAPRTLDLYP